MGCTFSTPTPLSGSPPSWRPPPPQFRPPPGAPPQSWPPPPSTPPPGAPPSTARPPPPAVVPRPPGRPSFPSALRSSWTEGTSTGYEAVKNAPQFLVIPAYTGRVRVTLKQDTNAPAAAVALLGGRAGGTRYVGRWDDDASGRWGNFSYGGGAVDLDVRQGESYTLLVVTHTKGLRIGGSRSLEFTVELSNAATGAPLPLQCALAPMGSQTLDGKESVRSVAEERARRAAALASMRAAAEASPLNSPQRAHWEDFQAATAAVEAKRAECRRAGARFNDGWSGTKAAVGDGWEEGAEAVWADMGELCEVPAIVEGGFSLEDVQQGALGNCYFMACLADLAGGKGSELLDAVFVTAEPNPEGVYCIRLWVDGAWQWFFMDAQFLCHPGVYRVGDTRGYSGEPDIAIGRFRCLVSVKSKAPSEMWPSFLEKAWAMLHGSYADTDGDRVADAPCCAVMSPSFPLNFFVPHSLPGYNMEIKERITQEKLDSMWCKLAEVHNQGFFLTACARDATGSGSTRRLLRNGADSDGIVRDHEFSVLDLLDRAELPRLLKMRNPHGEGEWTGEYSDGDLASWTPALRAATSYSPELSGDDGIFWMPLKAFAVKFEVVKVTPRISLCEEGGEWRKAHAPGTFTSAAVEKATKLAYPEAQLCFAQFLLKPLAQGAFFISVMQRARRGERSPVRKLEMTASLYSYSGSDGIEPAQKMDWYSIGSMRARVKHVSGLRDNGLLNFEDVSLTPEAGCYVIIPEFKSFLHSNVDFEVSVSSKTPFELRVAAPGDPRASESGVVWVSGRQEDTATVVADSAHQAVSTQNFAAANAAPTPHPSTATQTASLPSSKGVPGKLPPWVKGGRSTTAATTGEGAVAVSNPLAQLGRS